nr:FAD-dependent monooxygenase [Lichenihabitans psoromatis]
MQSLPSSTDILIVGAGPSGLALAAELRRLGASALLIDRQTEGANTSRAAVVHARTLEVLEPLGATEALLGIGLIVSTFQVRDRDNLLLSVDFADLPTRYPYALLCPQNKTEAVLLDRLHSLGGDVVRPVDVTTVRQGPLGAAVDMMIDGSTRTIETKWLIGCDGMNSIVREQSGIGFAGAAYPQDFVLADVRMDWPLPRDEVDLFLSPDGLMVVAPLPDDRFRVVATVTHAPEHPTTDAIEAILRQRGPATSSAIRVHDLIWSSRFRVHHRISDMPRKGRVLLCGDAAHVHSPAGGQGMEHRHPGCDRSRSAPDRGSQVRRRRRYRCLGKGKACNRRGRGQDHRQDHATRLVALRTCASGSEHRLQLAGAHSGRNLGARS